LKNFSELSNQLERLLRLRTYPIIYKFVKKGEEIPVQNVRFPKRRLLLCQIVNISRTYGWTFACTTKNLILPNCGSIVGLNVVPDELENGTMVHDVWFSSIEDAIKYNKNMVRIPTGLHDAIIISPLHKITFDPDLIVIYANAAQMILIINSLQWENYKKLKFSCVGESSCSDAVANCFMTGEPSLTIPCFGERRFAGVMDDELVIALPPDMLEKIINGLKKLKERKISYPICLHGITQDPYEGIPKTYHSISDKFMKEND
jgi:uncharacterized protein (DUF169 family)